MSSDRFSRRRFLKKSTLAALSLAGLGAVTPTTAANAQSGTIAIGYGRLRRDPDGILDLPRGFKYRIISRSGDVMTDGLRVPHRPDGMAAFAGPRGYTVLVRNHELGPEPASMGAFGDKNKRLSRVKPESFYDYGFGRMPGLGGTTTLIYDPASRRLVSQFLSLAGTYKNCAGGPTPWGSWISCEESVVRAGGDTEKDHGYAFEVPATDRPALADPVPLKAMGRFNREAVCVDPRTSIVYQTEDLGDGLLTRFIPDTPRRLAAGGRLQALAILGQPSRDTRNWPGSETEPFPIGQPLSTKWIDLDEVEAPRNDLRMRGFAAGAALFARGEGIWFGENEFYFTCTSGGPDQYGQIFRYRPSPLEGTAGETANPGTLELFLQPADKTDLENCDNLTIAPWGDLVVCEDGPGDNHLVGVRPDGACYKIARNATGPTEMCGACFSPSGDVLFANLQVPGLTVAITGPWQG
jgi:secreted PhoX family phosphatase